jgi:hypothetical protein
MFGEPKFANRSEIIESSNRTFDYLKLLPELLCSCIRNSKAKESKIPLDTRQPKFETKSYQNFQKITIISTLTYS